MLTASRMSMPESSLGRSSFALLVAIVFVATVRVSFAAGSGVHDENRHAQADSGPTSTQDEHIAEIDHPLWRGGLPEGQRGARISQFENDWHAIDFRKGEGGAVFKRYIDDLGVKQIVKYFEDKNPSCHGELHDLGALLIERTGNLAASLAMCDDACTYSCTHGVLRQYFSAHKGDKGGHVHGESGGAGYEDVQIGAVRDEIIELCRRDSTIIKGFLRGNCAHSIGHAFGIISGRNFRKAQEHCGVFEEATMQYYCESGVFMEFEHEMLTEFNHELSTKVAGWLKGKSGRMAAAIGYCGSKTQFVSACVRYFIKALHDYGEAVLLAEECQNLSGVARRSCFFSIGFASVSYVAANPQVIGRICAAGDASDREMCVSGLAFLKEGHDLKAAIVAGCNKLTAQRLKAVCLDQSQRTYYQTDNPLFAEMLAGNLRQR